jgi:hypothetical protein
MFEKLELPNRIEKLEECINISTNEHLMMKNDKFKGKVSKLYQDVYESLLTK